MGKPKSKFVNLSAFFDVTDNLNACLCYKCCKLWPQAQVVIFNMMGSSSKSIVGTGLKIWKLNNFGQDRINTVTLADISRDFQEAQDGMKELTSTQRREDWHVIKVARAGLALVICYSELALAVHCNVWDPWSWADGEVKFAQQTKADKEMVLPHITCKEDILCHVLIHGRNAQTAISTAHISSYCCAGGIVLADCTLTFPGR